MRALPSEVAEGPPRPVVSGLLVPVLVAVALAGCVGGPAGSSDPGSSPGETGDLDGLDDSPSRDQRAHVHDLWGDREVETLVDRWISIDAADPEPGSRGSDLPVNRCSGGWLTGLYVARPCLGETTFAPHPSGDPDDPNVVPPGTAAVRVTVDWNATSPVTGVQLEVDSKSWTFDDLYWSEPGGTVAIRASDIQENWSYFPLEVTDDGHATVSSWVFLAGAYSDRPAWAAHGSVHVTVEVVRTDGPLPAEPPHPDWYANTDAYRVATGNTSTDSPAVWLGPVRSEWVLLIADRRNPVPPGTQKVVVEVEVANDGPTAGTPFGEANATLEIFHPGAVRSTEHHPTRIVDDRLVFEIAVDERMTDSVYACDRDDTSWGFVLWLDPPTAAEDPVTGTPVRGASSFEGDVELTAAATEAVDRSPDALEPKGTDRVPGCAEARLT